MLAETISLIEGRFFFLIESYIESDQRMKWRAAFQLLEYQIWCGWVVVNPSSPSFNTAVMEGSPDFPCRHGPVLLRSPSLNLPNISSSITHLVIRSFYCGTCLPPSLTSGTWGSWSTKKCICPQSLLHERRKTYWHGYTLYWLLYSGYFKLEVW